MADHPRLRLFWKIARITLGSLLILLGLIMLVTPGPGWLAIFAGLALLSRHSRWAHNVMTWLKAKLHLIRRTPPSP
jgi:uncharacterized protein (TIGR02611 family)